MASEARRTSVASYFELLLKGQRVDWKYSLVVILVITGMFATPLTLGSIRNRVYVAVKAQIEKENNAREIAIHLSREEAPALDDEVVGEIRQRFVGTRVVGNHKLVVSVQGPEGSAFLTVQTLVPEDPRHDSLQIEPPVPADFGLTQVVVSDGLGRNLYGDEWDSLWGEDGSFSGSYLELEINDLSVLGQFQVVARRRLPGQGLYISPAAGQELRRYTQGFGSAELGLPIDQGLVQFALPKLVSESCTLILDAGDPTCGDEDREKLVKRLQAVQLQVGENASPALPVGEGFELLGVRLTERVETGGQSRLQDVAGDCQEALSPHLVSRCTSALILADVAVEVTLTRGRQEAQKPDPAAAAGDEPEATGARAVTVVGISRPAVGLLPEAAALRDQHGTAPPSRTGAPGLSVPFSSGFNLGETVVLESGGGSVPGLIESFYGCAGDDCPIYASALATYRLQNLRDGLVEVRSQEPLVFVPAQKGNEYDELLVYTAEVEDVEPLAADLREAYPGYNVGYNAAAIDKLKRQDSRLSTLFTITMTLSSIFIVLALGSLAQINVERRSRQMAQMLILGFSRRFVRWLVVGEYLLLTVISALTALALTSFLCFVARRLLLSQAADGAARGFQVIVNSMNVDADAFFLVFGIVAICAWAIAILSAATAARSDPLKLLD